VDERTATEQLAVAGEELRVADEELRAQHDLIEELIRNRAADRAALSQLASAVPVPLLDTDSAGLVAGANLAAGELLRVGTASLVGRPVVAFVAAEDRRSVRAALSLALAGRGAQHVTAQLRPRASTPVHTELAIVPAAAPPVRFATLGRRVAAHWVVVTQNPAAAPDTSVVDALAELATLAVATSDLHGALGRVAALAVRGVRWADSASILVGHPKAPEFLVATDQRAQAGDGGQHRAEQGPVWDAYASGAPTGTPRLEADERWRRLGADRPPAGGALAVPLAAADPADRPVGVLVLYGSAELGTEPAAATRAAMFAGGAAAVLREHREVVELRTLERQLRGALESRAVIEQAKGIIMAQVGCGPDEAFAMLSQASQTRNVKLRAVAAQLVSEVSAARPAG
jgi:hypothetical protein